MKKLFVFVALLVLLTPKMGRAQFGGIVYDPTNFHNAVLRYFQLSRQLTQLRSTYRNAVNKYNLARQMARSIENMPERYRAQFSQWRNLTTVPDTYQNTSGWVQGANTGNLSMVENGYRQATDQLERYTSDEISSMPSKERQRVLANYANVELADGVNTSSLATIGTLRADAPEIQRQIENLESDSLSSSPGLNSQVAVLNKINAANVLTLRTLQDANNLRLSQLEQQVLASQEKRDAMTTAINAGIYQRQNLVPEVSNVTHGLGTSLANYQLP